LNWLGYVAIGLLLIVTGGWIGVVELPKPQVQGTLQVEGLIDEVDIIRDQWGIPHIFARNENDLFFAQGFVTAQDRLWQLELSRRLGAGTLSEVFGELALGADKSIRTLGLNRAAQASVEMLSSKTQARLEAYINGINAWISKKNFPLEFMILGFKPDPWKLEDVFHVSGGMAMTLQDSYNTIIKRARAQTLLAPELFSKINTPYDTTGSFGVNAAWSGEVVAHSNTFTELAKVNLSTTTLNSLGYFSRSIESMSHWMPLGEGIGSNAWAVHGSLTDSGMPYLANDPHLPNRQPATWYEVHLNAPDWNVTGASLPGLPGVVIGHNEHIAWGVTNGYLATQDLFIEQFNVESASSYQFQGALKQAEIIQEKIYIKGQKDPINHEVILTHHGPVITDLIDTEQAIALGWTFIASQEIDQLGGLLHINQATDWDAFRAGVAQVPFDLNFVYADVGGNIGYQLSGLLPQRTSAYNGLPVEGWTGEHEWTGIHGLDDLPHTYNPDTGFVATANHRPFGPELMNSIPGEWSPPFRSERITILLEDQAPFSIEDMKAFQADAFNQPLYQLADWMRSIESQDKTHAQALDIIKSWNGVVLEESQAPVILDAIARNLIAKMFGSRLTVEANFIGFQGSMYWLLEMAELDRNNSWFDDPSTPGVENFGDLLLSSFHQTIEMLTETVGPIKQWTWGRLKPVTFFHPLGSAPVIGGLFNLTTPTAGGRFTLNRDNASYRTVIDLGKLNNSFSELTTGQSGHPFSKHYRDQLEDWRHVEFHPMLWTAEAIKDHREAHLKLRLSN